MRTSLTVRSVILFTRVLLCVQGVLIATLAWAALLTLQPGSPREPNLNEALVASVVAVASLITAILMKQRRKWAAISAFAIEGLWTVVALWSAALPAGPPHLQYFLGAALSLAALVGLLLKPVRAYFALTSIVQEP